jgi:hypothetical protein
MTMKIGSKRSIQLGFLLLWLLSIGVLGVYAQDGDEEQPPEMLRLDDRAQVRVINASLVLTQANILLDGTLYFHQIPAGYISPYMAVPNGSGEPHTVQAGSPGPDNAELSTSEATFENNKDYTIVLFDTADGPAPPWIIADDNSQPLSPGMAGIRLVRAASPNVPNVELCVGDYCALLTQADKLSNYIPLESKSYPLTIRVLGDVEEAVKAPPIMFKAGEIYSIFLFDPPSEQTIPQVLIYIDTVQSPAQSALPQPYPAIPVGLPQPWHPSAPAPVDGQIPPPQYPPVTGAFLSPTAMAVLAVIMMIFVGTSWAAWRQVRRYR